MDDKPDTLEELLKMEASPERVDELMKLVEIDLPVSDEIKRFLLKQQVEMFQISTHFISSVIHFDVFKRGGEPYDGENPGRISLHPKAVGIGRTGRSKRNIHGFLVD